MISKRTIDEILLVAKIEEVVGDFVSLKKRGQNWVGLCPFHEDKTPNVQVYYKTHTAYRFSPNCSTHGKSLDVIDFIKYQEKCNKHEAILKAQEMIGFINRPVLHQKLKPISFICRRGFKK